MNIKADVEAVLKVGQIRVRPNKGDIQFEVRYCFPMNPPAFDDDGKPAPITYHQLFTTTRTAHISRHAIEEIERAIREELEAPRD